MHNFRLTKVQSPTLVFVALFFASMTGCKGYQYARVIKPGEREMVGSHKAGQETFRPLVEEAVAKLISRHESNIYHQVSVGPNGEPLPPPKTRLCFVGIENRTAEDLGDFKEQLYTTIDAKLFNCNSLAPISRHYVDAGLKELRLRPEDLFLRDNMWRFQAVMQRENQPFDHLLFAKLNSGSTQENKDYQRDYLLALELVDIRTGERDLQTAELSKGYHHSWTSRAWSKMNPFGN